MNLHHKRPVDIIVRSDDDSKPGGDSIQVKYYFENLQKHGFDPKIVKFRPEMKLRPGSIVHIINVDRPFDFLEAVRQSRGHPLFVSPIHHSLERLRLYRRYSFSKSLAGLIGRYTNEATREWLAFLGRGVRTSDTSMQLSYLRMFIRYGTSVRHIWSRVGRALNSAEKVFLLANGEGNDLKRDTGWLGLNGVLAPNGLPDSKPATSENGNLERNITILCVGRVEPRKRQLELAQAAEESGTPVTFVGAVNRKTKYGQSFLNVTESSRFSTWIGHLPHPEVIHVMRRSKVLLNASYVEVQSMVDIEASFQGCLVVNTEAGHSREWLTEVHTVPVLAPIKDLLALAKRVSQKEGVAGLATSYTWTWEKTTLIIANSYLSAGFPSI
jgi:glycosyltransferase involved in cell wall biosynthesis